MNHVPMVFSFRFSVGFFLYWCMQCCCCGLSVTPYDRLLPECVDRLLPMEDDRVVSGYVGPPSEWLEIVSSNECDAAVSERPRSAWSDVCDSRPQKRTRTETWKSDARAGMWSITCMSSGTSRVSSDYAVFYDRFACCSTWRCAFPSSWTFSPHRMFAVPLSFDRFFVYSSIANSFLYFCRFLMNPLAAIRSLHKRLVKPRRPILSPVFRCQRWRHPLSDVLVKMWWIKVFGVVFMFCM